MVKKDIYFIKGNLYKINQKITNFDIYKNILMDIYKLKKDFFFSSFKEIYNLKFLNLSLNLKNKKIIKKETEFWYSLTNELENFKINKIFLQKINEIKNKEEFVNFLFLLLFERNKILNIVLKNKKEKKELNNYLYNFLINNFDDDIYLYTKKLKNLKLKNILNKEIVLLDIDKAEDIYEYTDKISNKTFWIDGNIIYYSNMNVILSSTKKIYKKEVINFDFKDEVEFKKFFELLNNDTKNFLKYMIYLAINNFDKIESYNLLDEYEYRSKFIDFIISLSIKKNISINKNKIYNLYKMYCQIYGLNYLTKKRFYNFFNMKYKKYIYEKNINISKKL